ncbi:helix-turn-helix domain-containing protein [Sorangium sp. So ce385]|uniref:helix-turn-helix domain-containing protein n=1 Tax=Sorangium sp. So ce385 TaxID=3133308 RepID=UPI003F5B4ECB
MRLSSWFDVVYLLGTAQGLLTFALLWARRQNRTANRILAFPIAAIAASCAYVLYLRSGAFRSDPRWLLAIDTLPALYGPLFYLYARALTSRPRRWGPQLLHLVPFALYTLYDIPRFLLPGEEKLALMAREARGELAWDQALWQWGVELQGLGYLVAALWAVRRYRAAVAGEFSNADRINLRWLQRLLGSLLVLWLGSMFARISPVPVLGYLHTALMVLVYVIAYRGASEPQVAPALGDGPETRASAAAASAAEAHEPSRGEGPAPAATSPMTAPGREPEPATDVPGAPGGAEPAPAAARSAGARPAIKYQKTRLKEGQVARIASQLVALFERERPYRDPDLTLSALAQRLGVPPYHLSQVLNDRFGKSFHDVVNLARVEELKRRLLDRDLPAEKILALGLDCGFSSKSTLNANFKKHTGLTPTQFRDRELARRGAAQGAPPGAPPEVSRAALAVDHHRLGR